jgi:hypothetical protein
MTIPFTLSYSSHAQVSILTRRKGGGGNWLELDILALSGLAGDFRNDEADRLGDQLALLPGYRLARLVARPHLAQEGQRDIQRGQTSGVFQMKQFYCTIPKFWRSNHNCMTIVFVFASKNVVNSPIKWSDLVKSEFGRF